jgi:hypothetical protein
LKRVVHTTGGRRESEESIRDIAEESRWNFHQKVIDVDWNGDSPTFNVADSMQLLACTDLTSVLKTMVSNLFPAAFLYPSLVETLLYFILLSFTQRWELYLINDNFIILSSV